MTAMRFCAAFLTLSCLLASAAGAATLEEDVTRYIAIFEGDTRQHNDAVESLAWMGLSDPRLFDVIEKRLLAEFDRVRRDRKQKDRVARYVRALGFSGQAKYEPTLRRMADDGIYGRYGRQALVDLPSYAGWNPVISDRNRFDPALDDEANRTIIMLRADDLMLKRLGAKRVYFGTPSAFGARHEAVLAVLVEQAKAQYPRSIDSDDRDTVDSIAWLVKAVGSIEREAYRPLLVEIYDSDAHSSVHSWARSGLWRLDHHASKD